MLLVNLEQISEILSLPLFIRHIHDEAPNGINPLRGTYPQFCEIDQAIYVY